MRSLIYRNADIFAKHDFDLGTCNLVRHEIDTGDHPPIKSHAYKIAFSERETLAKIIKGMLQAGIIRPSTSAWSFPCLLVKKHEANEYRLVIDYRRLNKCLKVEQYRIPEISEIIYSLNSARKLSSMDMVHGYHQIEIEEKDREKTAFITFQGLYEYTKMPMGISNAGFCWQRMIEICLANILWKNAFAYLDDVLVVSKTFEEHLVHLQQVFNRFRKANLKVKLRKCKFLREELPFLGYVVTKDGLRPDPAKVDRVNNYPRPNSVTELRTFLGMISYYRRYLDSFSQLASPLHQLLCKAAKFVWTNTHETAFQTLKQKLTTAPLLAYPCFDKPFIVHTDASGKGIAAILSQIGEDKFEHPIIYASRTLSKSERNYSTTEQEGLAVIFALKTFRPFIYQQPTTLYTDHVALKYLVNTTSSNTRLARWTLQMQEYFPKLEIKYRPGKGNANADALSRALPELSKIENEPHDENEQCNAITTDTPETENQIPDQEVSDLEKKIAEKQREDTHLRRIIEYLEHGTLPDEPKEAEQLKIVSERYTIERGLLLYQPNVRAIDAVLEIPTSMIPEILQQQHNSAFGAHLGMDKMYGKIKTRYHWRTMYKDIRDYCRSCYPCARQKRPQRNLRATLHPIMVTEPWEMLACDLISPLPQTRNYNEHLLVFTCMLTGFVEAFPLRKATAETVANVYMQEIVCRYGPCRYLKCDQGPQFTAALTKSILDICQTQLHFSPPYSPWCQGKVERHNGFIVDIISNYTEGDDWDEKVRYAIFAINTAICATRKQSPYFLLFGRDAQMPSDTAFQYKHKMYAEDENLPESIMDHFANIYAKARDEIEKAKTRQKRAYDRHAEDPNIKRGDIVLLRDDNTQRNPFRKFAHPWRKAYRVTKVEMPELIVKRIHNALEPERRVHVNNVKPYHNPDLQQSLPPLESESDSDSEGSIEY